MSEHVNTRKPTTSYGDYKEQTGWNIVGSMATGALNGALAGGVLGGFAGGVIGLITGIIGVEAREKEYVSGIRNAREAETKYRNNAIRNAKQIYSSTKTNFNTKYGTGKFEELEKSFYTVLGMKDQQSLGQILSNMAYDTSAVNVTSKLTDNSLISSDNAQEIINSSFSLSDFNDKYIEYFQEQLRAADTEFGMQMEALSREENEALKDYENTLGAYHLQNAEQFAQAFLQRKSQAISDLQTLGQASVAQSTSGFRQTGSGRNLTIEQEYRMDLADVAYASTINYYINQYKFDTQAYNRQIVNTIYQTRNSISRTTAQIMADVEMTMQESIKQQGDAYIDIRDSEEAKYEYTNQLDDINDVDYSQDVVTGDIF